MHYSGEVNSRRWRGLTEFKFARSTLPFVSVLLCTQVKQPKVKLPTKCLSPADAEETRSRRVSSSPSWSSVSPSPIFTCIRLVLTRRFSPRATGASGTGRTTFVNTLCESEVLAHKISDNPDTAHIEEGIRIKPVNVGQLHQTPGVYITFKHIVTELEEDGVRIALTIVDTPGFGDNIDNEFAFVPHYTLISH